jgi:hypothetical protein
MKPKMDTNYEQQETGACHDSGYLIPGQASHEPQLPNFKKLPIEIRWMIWEMALLELEFVEVEGFIAGEAHNNYHFVNFHGKPMLNDLVEELD